ncbi:hypothetical protein [Sphingobium baderi]|uniref:hypothetical protein n=2 Tax=Sphingobium TaxID=165695 RepID=UPI002B402475|nr:hypothetical protein [Sphingobium baderi]WRD77161.1 hypothetical protein QQ987_03210 [Sphingobium baderi]
MTDSFLANIWSTKDTLASKAGQQLSHKRSRSSSGGFSNIRFSGAARLDPSLSKACRRLRAGEIHMIASEDAAARRSSAIRLMERALAELEAIDDGLGAMRLQHAIDVVRASQEPDQKAD